MTDRVHKVAVAQRLKREFGEVLSDDVITSTLDESFDTWATARIDAFVPVLAERAARARLRALAQADPRPA